MKVKGLRAKVRRSPDFNPLGLWEWSIKGANVAPMRAPGYTNVGYAIADANEAVKDILNERTTDHARRDIITADCPDCGDPAEYTEQVHPGSTWFTYSCDSCGHYSRDWI